MKRIIFVLLLLVLAIFIFPNTVISPSSIYWFLRLDSLKNFFKISSYIFIIGFSLFFIIYLTDSSLKNNKLFKTIFIIIAILTVLNPLFYIFLPTSKEMIFIIGIPMILNNENLQEIINKVFNKIGNFIEPSGKEIKKNELNKK